MKRKWEIVKGSIPILLVASHNHPHIRKGKIKPRDLGTGRLARLICKQTGAWGIISTSVQLDPNWYTNSSFREKVHDLIKSQSIIFVIDLHGRKENYPYLVEVLINNSLKKRNIKIPRNFHLSKFKKDKQLTLAEDLDKRRIACAELEIRKDGRLEELNKKRFEFVINELIKFIKNISKK